MLLIQQFLILNFNTLLFTVKYSQVPPNSKRLMGVKKQILYSGPANIRRNLTKLVARASCGPGLYTPEYHHLPK